MKLLLTSFFLMAMAVCPEQQFLPTTDLDLEQIATDPVTGQKLVYCRLAGYTGHPVTITGYVCDRDNDDPTAPAQVLRVWREPGNVSVPIAPDGSYTIAVTYAMNGWHYETVGVTDGIDIRLGTVAIFTRTNTPPVNVCGGRP